MNYSIIKNAYALKKKIIKHLNPITIPHNNRITKTVSIIRADTVTKIPHVNPMRILTELNSIEKSRVFIIGGGPSLCNFNFNLLKGEDLIAVNKAIEYVDFAKYFITMDYTFIASPSKLSNADFNIIKNKSEFNYFVINKENIGIKNINGVYTDTINNIKYNNLYKFTGIIESNKSYDTNTGFGNELSKFSHGQNSGYCALQLALLLGYDEIYLLGFDLNTNTDMTHFHSGYRQSLHKFNNNLNEYKTFFEQSLNLSKIKDKIISCSPISYLNNFIKYKDVNEVLSSQITQRDNMIQHTNSEVIIVGYYTVNTPYEKEAEGLINSCKKLNLVFDITGVPNLGGWQANTRFKAKFMLDMLHKYPGKKLLYVDCDAVIHSEPLIFNNYNYDIGIRYQDFNWRKNECLSGTILMRSNDRTIALCKRWIEINASEGPATRNLEQWNLDKAIQEGVANYGLTLNNLPPEYTFIFDIMKKIYSNVTPVITHYQASRRFKNRV